MYSNHKDYNVPGGGSHAEGIGGSIRTSRHSALLEVVDHSRCRMMFAVQSHERITRKKTGSARDHQEEHGFREEEDVERAVAESLLKNIIVAHPVQGSQADEGSGGTCSPAPPCVQRYGTGKSEGC